MQRAWFLRVIFPKQGHGSLSDYPPTKSDAEVSIHTTWVAARKLITAKNKTVTAGQETGVSIIIQPETADMHNWESHRIGVVTVRSPDSMARGTVEITRVAADRQRADALVTFRAESKAALFNLLNLLKDPPGQRGVLRQVLTQLSTRRVA